MLLLDNQVLGAYEVVSPCPFVNLLIRQSLTNSENSSIRSRCLLTPIIYSPPILQGLPASFPLHCMGVLNLHSNLLQFDAVLSITFYIWAGGTDVCSDGPRAICFSWRSTFAVFCFRSWSQSRAIVICTSCGTAWAWCLNRRIFAGHPMKNYNWEEYFDTLERHLFNNWWGARTIGIAEHETDPGCFTFKQHQDSKVAGYIISFWIVWYV